MRDTLCWNCKNTSGNKCTWFSEKAKPVDGWEAVRRDIFIESGSSRYRKVKSYYVIDCPNFVKEDIERLTDDQFYVPSDKEREMLKNALRKCMKDHDVTQQYLAEKMGKCIDTIYKYLRGKTVYSVRSVAEVMPEIYDYIKAEA